MIRPAEAHEAALLTELALRSKAYWGYDADFLAACRLSLTVTEYAVKYTPVFVDEQDGTISGFYSLREHSPQQVELDLLFIDPLFIRQGIGERLYAHALQTARRSVIRPC